MSDAWARYRDCLGRLAASEAEYTREQSTIEKRFQESGITLRRAQEARETTLSGIATRSASLATDVRRLAGEVGGIAPADPAAPLVPTAGLASALAGAEKLYRRTGETRDWLARFAAQESERQAAAQRPVTPAPVVAAPVPTVPEPSRSGPSRGLLVGAIVTAVILVFVVVVVIVVAVS